jgi:hypothetical protein
VQTARRAGLATGMLLIAQMVGSYVVNFYLEKPLFGAEGFLTAAAPHLQQIAAAVLLGLATEATYLGIAIAIFPVSFRRSQALTLWLTALAAVVLAVSVMEGIGVLSMVSLSGAYTSAAAAGREPLAAAGVVASFLRNWAHYLARILDGVTALAFYVALYRVRLVPRVLAALGIAAALLMVTVVARPLFGADVVFPLLAPLGLAHLLAAAWLIARGFRQVPASARKLSAAAV